MAHDRAEEVAMLEKIYPRGHARLLPLTLLGPHADDFATWLVERAYPRVQIQRRLRRFPLVEDRLLGNGVADLTEVSAQDLLACGPGMARDDPYTSALVHSLVEYLSSKDLLRVPAPGRSESLVARYLTFMQQVRGCSASTRECHAATVRELLDTPGHEDDDGVLGGLDSAWIEAFVGRLGERLGRGSLQHAVGHIRAFLRYAASEGLAPVGLDERIDTPRLYRDEALPRALPWKTVRALLGAIDRTTALGRRDYAMFLLMATYGLRNCEVASLRLDDIDWRHGKLYIRRSKTRSTLVHPITDEVATGLVAYLRDGRPSWNRREVFLRGRLPIGGISSTAVTEAFQKWVQRSGLPVPYYGAHCLRHSLAIRLLRKGADLKTIGDLLGHRSIESTGVYLRLHTEDLRDVGLDLPVTP